MSNAPFQPEPVFADDGRPLPDHWMSELGTLLSELEGVEVAEAVPPAASPALAVEAMDSQFVERRLGIASSLFAALQCKHSGAAGHSLRVALTCSAWARQMGLDEGRRELLELSALLHDIGIIGVPDNILMKPGLLDSNEAAVMVRSRAMTLEILQRCCTSPEVLRIVENVPGWFDGSRQASPLQGADIPLAARMIAIAEAFDAMITDHVYRPAMPHERAMGELYDCAGTQFDPQLVKQFAEFRETATPEIHEEVATRWLQCLDPELANSYWELNCVPSPAGPPGGNLLFHAKLLDNMYDAVAFVDAAGRVVLWNHGAERLTGIAATGLRQKQWHPDILNMADERDRPVTEADCPVLSAIRSGVQSLRRLTVWRRNGRRVSVDTHAVPVIAEDGTTQGAILLLHDASSESTLEQQCQNLHEKATRDPLTQVANRAEFDRVHAMFVATHQQQQVPCSLLMCDLDRFKGVNDTYGHQAGDDAIKSLAALLKGACRPGDLVARYGGEEFVMLCADCDNAAAARRAEQVRKSLAQMAQPRMSGRSVTVSFGVTEIQPGDTPETMLRRADRALLMAKANGRNTVVQLGTGSRADEADAKPGIWPFTPTRPAMKIEQVLVTSVPVNIALEKIRGFVADHQAGVLKIDGSEVQLEMADRQPGRLRRLTDRPVSFQLNLHLEEERVQKGVMDRDQVGSIVVRTRIRVVISPRKNRDRRRNDVAERAREVLASLRSYLMAAHDDEGPPPSQGPLHKVKHMLIPWLNRK